MISPAQVTVTIGQSHEFAVEVSGTHDHRVEWRVDGIPGGDAVVGTIDGLGVYTAPQYPPENDTVTVTAVSQVDSTKSAAATVAIRGPSESPMHLWTTYVEPPHGNRGLVQGLTINESGDIIGAGYVSDRNITGTFRIVATSIDPFGRERWVFASDVDGFGKGLLLGADGVSVLVYGYYGDSGDPLVITLDNNGRVVQDATCVGAGADFIGADRDENRAYYAGGVHPGIFTSDLAGTLNCDTPIDGRTEDLPDPRTLDVTPMPGGLVIAGHRAMSNTCWSGRYGFIQEVSAAGALAWRLDFEALLDNTQATLSSPRMVSTLEEGERVTYVTASVSTSRGEDCNPPVPEDLGRFMTARVKADGTLDWVRLWDGENAPSCEAYPVAIAASSRGGAVIAGYATAAGCDPYHCAAAYYSSEGSLQWTLKPEIEGHQVLCTAATVSGDGRFLYLGGGGFDNPSDLFVAKYALP